MKASHRSPREAGSSATRPNRSSVGVSAHRSQKERRNIRYRHMSVSHGRAHSTCSARVRAYRVLCGVHSTATAPALSIRAVMNSSPRQNTAAARTLLRTCADREPEVSRRKQPSGRLPGEQESGSCARRRNTARTNAAPEGNPMNMGGRTLHPPAKRPRHPLSVPPPTPGRLRKHQHRANPNPFLRTLLRKPLVSPYPTLDPPARTRKTPPPRPASRARPPPPPPWIRTRSVSTRQGRVRKMIPVSVCAGGGPEVLWLLHYPASVRQGQYPCREIRRIFLSFRDL